jgi:hypothetical protein
MSVIRNKPVRKTVFRGDRSINLDTFETVVISDELYKTNGEERYPDFKLYKMIARNVHNHTPHAQLSKPIFAEYEFPKKKVKTTHRILNIDKMPSYLD